MVKVGINKCNICTVSDIRNNKNWCSLDCKLKSFILSKCGKKLSDDKKTTNIKLEENK